MDAGPAMCRYTEDGRPLAGPQAQPFAGGGLGIEVQQGRAVALHGVARRQVGSDGGLAAATLGIEYQNALHARNTAASAADPGPSTEPDAAPDLGHRIPPELS